MIGKLIRDARRERGWTQTELAQQVGVGTPYLSKIEQGKEMPGEPLMLRLAAALGLDADELVLASGRIPMVYVNALTERPAAGAQALRQFVHRYSRGAGG